MEKESSREQMILNNLPLVPFILSKIDISLPPIMSREDALQCGYSGLIEAVDHYQEELGCFSTFASIRIRGSILDGVYRYSFLSRHYYRLLALDREQDNRVYPTIVQEEVKDEDTDYVIGIYQEGMRRTEEKLLLEQAMSKLTYMELTVIKSYYYDQKGFNQIAADIHRSKSWVCKIHQRALKKLKKDLVKDIDR